MSEREIVRRIMAAIREAGGYCVKYHGGPYSHAGTPDILGCYRGRMLALEVKRPGGKATALQAAQIRLWEAAGAVADVVHSVAEVEALLREVEDT